MVDILVTLSLCGILLSMFLPSILRARESARRIECLSRLAELARAAVAYETTHQSLPSTDYVYDNGALLPIVPTVQSSWLPLLPFVGHDTLYQSIDMGAVESGRYPSPPSSLRNAFMLTTDIPLFVCPSDGWMKGGCNYRVCHGTAPFPIQRPWQKGASYALAPVGSIVKARLCDISDGLSQTVLYSEKIQGDANPSDFSQEKDTFFVPENPSVYRDSDAFIVHCVSNWGFTSQHFSYSGASWSYSSANYTWYNHVTPPNAKLPDCATGSASDDPGKLLSIVATAARSWHGGGVNAVCADGSGRFVSEDIDLQVWRAVGSRAGNESVSDW